MAIVDPMQATISNRVIVLTGAARGIGQAIAQAVLEQGGKLVALDLRWDEDDAFYRELKAHPDALPLSCDILSEPQIGQALAATLQKFGPPDVLINNAAMRQRDYFPEDGACAVLDVTDPQWERMFAVNVVGQMRITRAFIAPMIERKRGHIINISAKGGVNYAFDGERWSMGPHLRLNQPYDASKAAFSNLSFYLAEEMREHGVAVNVVFPGAIRSTGVDAMEEGRKKLGIQMNLAEPEQVVPVVMHLASQAGTAITGCAYSSVMWNQQHAAATADAPAA
jgi:NAD(P)-dependent dehydrogenase (short-subunit alcohol dehydrogenase family)